MATVFLAGGAWEERQCATCLRELNPAEEAAQVDEYANHWLCMDCVNGTIDLARKTNGKFLSPVEAVACLWRFVRGHDMQDPRGDFGTANEVEPSASYAGRGLNRAWPGLALTDYEHGDR